MSKDLIQTFFMHLHVIIKNCTLCSEDNFFLSEYQSTYRVSDVPAHGVIIYPTVLIPSQVNNFANICENSLILLEPVVERCHCRYIIYERDVSYFLCQLCYYHVCTTPSHRV